MPKISVVVPVKNGGDKLEKCLKAILDQTLIPFEIIIVDGHSTDNTVEIARKYSTKVLFEDFGTVGGARQIGIESSLGEYIAFTDADCIPEKDWLKCLTDVFSEDVIGVGGGIKNIGSGLWMESIAMALNTFLGSANSVQDRVFKNKKFVNSISGCNCIYRKDDLIKIGGFDTSYSLNEDTELNARLLQVGKILYTPNAIVCHNQDRTFIEFMKRIYSFGYGRGKNRLWDLQVVPPVLFLITCLSLITYFDLFLLMISSYLALLVIFTSRIIVEQKKLIYLISIPLVYIAEHTSYVIGFWKGIAGSLRFNYI